jgi:hypothetical protein
MAVPVKKFAGRTTRICSSIRQAFVRIYLQKRHQRGVFWWVKFSLCFATFEAQCILRLNALGCFRRLEPFQRTTRKKINPYVIRIGAVNEAHRFEQLAIRTSKPPAP